MASAGDGDTDTVLSDVEGDDPVPIVVKSPSEENICVERFREVLAELERERQAREVAENSRSELQLSFNRLKALAHEAIKKRDEIARQRDEALREKEEALKSNEKVSAELSDALRLRDEISNQRDELAQQFNDAVKAKDTLRSEIEASKQMFVTGIEKISGKVSKFKNFSAGGLPRSHKYTGLPAVAYGVIKRTNEIVEELLKQIDTTAKSRNEAREQMEQRNYEVAIEVSQLEATIDRLREEISRKTSLVENLEKIVTEKDLRISDMERELPEKLKLAENEALELRQLVNELDVKLADMEANIDSQRPLLIDQLNLISKTHDQLYDVIKTIGSHDVDQTELSESLFLPKETDIEENLRASLAGMESISELSSIIVAKTRDLIEESSREARSLNETVARLTKEKEHIASLLRSALSRRMMVDSSKTTKLFQVAENGLKEAGIEVNFSNLLADGKIPTSNSKDKALEMEEDEIYTLVIAY